MKSAASLLSALLVALVPFGAWPALALELRLEPRAVVELFTSQGCARCPEADGFLGELGSRHDIVALAYHIDYWDYAGWEDTFALPANTQLQKAYALSWGKNRVYTPQMVINGRNGLPGSHRDEVSAALAQAVLPLSMRLDPQGEEAVALSVAGQTGHRPAIIWLVTYMHGAQVVIERGENSGQALDYSHIVTARLPIGMWDPQEGASFVIPLAEILGPKSDGAAILIQEKNGQLPGAIIGAAAISR